MLILFIIGLGIFYISTESYDPFMPAGFGPVLTGAATVFFAVFGYDAMSTAAEEAEDGKKHMPKAIVLSLVIAMTLYVAATLVLTGMQRYTDIDPEAGFASAFTGVGLEEDFGRGRPDDDEARAPVPALELGDLFDELLGQLELVRALLDVRAVEALDVVLVEDGLHRLDLLELRFELRVQHLLHHARR